MSKFASCFIDQSDMFNYDILLEGELIAKAKTLSFRDQAEIDNRNRKVYEDGQLKPDPTANQIDAALTMIAKALTWWDSDKAITEDNIALLPPEVLNHIITAVAEHEQAVKVKAEDTEKN